MTIGKYLTAGLALIIFGAGCLNDGKIQRYLSDKKYAVVSYNSGGIKDAYDIENPPWFFDEFDGNLTDLNRTAGNDPIKSDSIFFPDCDNDGKVAGIPVEYKFDSTKNQFVSIDD